MNKFYKNLFKRNILYLVGILILIGFLVFLKMDIENLILKINQKHDILVTRSNSLRSLVSLRGDLEKVKPYFSLLENILPPRDQLLVFSKELENIARKNNLEFSFTFGEEKLASDKEPGHISFRTTLIGGYDGFTGFLKSVETGRYFVDFSSVDMAKRGDGFSAVINGKVFFR